MIAATQEENKPKTIMKDNNKKRKPHFRPTGKSDIEQWYSFARKWCSVFVDRQKNNLRCRHCFNTKYYYSRTEYVKAPRYGCDGCSEMEEFYKEAKAFFRKPSAGKGAN